MKRFRFSILGLTAAAALAAGPGVAWAGSPAVTLSINDTTDFWQNVRGGLSRGGTTLNKLQAAILVDGQGAGLPGLHLYAQVFKTNDESLSLARTGDVQTASISRRPARRACTSCGSRRCVARTACPAGPCCGWA
jgi:hypothetical protein